MATGSLQAMEHVANWVRFADTKATILAAGLGIVVTMLMTNASTVEQAIRAGCVGGFVVAALAVAAAVAALWTLWWIVSAVAPRTSSYDPEMNRFAWPALAAVSIDEVRSHVGKVCDPDDDAWRQTRTLADIADRKFRACKRAVFGFAALLPIGVACVVAAFVVR